MNVSCALLHFLDVNSAQLETKVQNVWSVRSMITDSSSNWWRRNVKNVILLLSTIWTWKVENVNFARK